ncbi:hypothetical protein QOT17_024834 [Balamuthia mandrillaris]
MSGTTCQPFAFMRLTHEAFRASMRGLEEGLSAASAEELEQRLIPLLEACELHLEQEERVFFVRVGEKDPGLCSPFSLEHEEDINERDRLKTSLSKAKTEGDGEHLEAFKTLLKAWLDHCHKHLTHEEQVMQPFLQSQYKFEEACSVVNEIVHLDFEQTKQMQVPFVVQLLNPQQRVGYLSALKGSVGDEVYANISSHLGACLSSEAKSFLQEKGLL